MERLLWKIMKILTLQIFAAIRYLDPVKKCWLAAQQTLILRMYSRFIPLWLCWRVNAISKLIVLAASVVFDAFRIATEHLVDVKRELGQFAQWNNLGLNLGLSLEYLEVIDSESIRIDDKLTKVLSQWLKRNYNVEKYGMPTWRALVNGVYPINQRLASEIKNRRLSWSVCLQYVHSITSCSLHAALNAPLVSCTYYINLVY